MVGCEIADDPHVVLVGRGKQPFQRLFSAQVWVDHIEGCSVVPVAGVRRENGCQVNDVCAKIRDVVDVLRHSIKVSAVELAPSDSWFIYDRRIPRLRDRPARRRVAVLARSGETVGEDLIDDALGQPLGRVRIHRDPEV